MGFLIVFGGTFLIFAGFVIYEKFFRKIDYNSIVARHIDRGGGHYFAQLKPKGNHVPWLWRYSWLDFKEKPLWVWKEVRVETTESETKVSYRKEPWEPYSPIGLTSEELAEDINWDDAKFYMSSPAGWREAVKMGLAILLVGLCLFGIMIVLDYMQGGV